MDEWKCLFLTLDGFHSRYGRARAIPQLLVINETQTWEHIIDLHELTVNEKTTMEENLFQQDLQDKSTFFNPMDVGAPVHSMWFISCSMGEVTFPQVVTLP